MRKRVTIVELAMFERMVPLMAGYLQAYASADPHLASTYAFEKMSMPPTKAAGSLIARLSADPSDIYAFSCYVWNTALITSILRELRRLRPEASYLLGGPQVMHHASRYLDPAAENVAICNGEGEQTFAAYLSAMSDTKPDLSTVKGISFYRDGTLVTTPAAERLHGLDALPSPFLSGLFDGDYTTSVLETNRGCPFRCGFCFWGAATNDRVFKFDETRVRDELTWISRAGIQFLYIADANWGMLKRDVGLTQHIADCKRQYDMPHMIYYSSAKNNPDRVTEITKILRDVDLMITQPVSLQTTSPESLALIERQNIKSSTYITIQQRVNELGISSYIELIWPLPGETLTSFRDGIGRLYAGGASTIIVYPHLLLHNTPLYKRRDEFDFVTRSVDEEFGEGEIVVSTSTVDEAAFGDGIRFFYALHLLRNGRALYHLSRYLHETGVRRHTDLIADFAQFCMGRREAPYSQFVERSIETNDVYDFTNYGRATHLNLHAERRACNDLLRDFAASQPWWADKAARCIFDLDHVMKPYVFSTTRLDEPVQSVDGLYVEKTNDRAYLVDVPARFAPLCSWYVFGDRSIEAATYRIDHHRRQYPYMKGETLQHNASLCHAMILRIQEIVPACHREDLRSLTAAAALA